MPFTIPPQGALGSPTGFIALSLDNQVGLSWQAVATATTYFIQRSTDNSTWTTVSQTSNLILSDTPPALSTVYYYQVIAATGSISSPASSSLPAQALPPGQTTLYNLRTLCRQRCNMENSALITTQEWNSMISASNKELQDILIQKFGNDYEVATPYTYTTVGNQNLYPLPPDFYKSLLVEVALNPGDPNSWVTLRKFERIQQNLWNYPNVYTFYGITNMRYRFTGTNLHIVPMPQAGQTLRLWYAPRPADLVNDMDIVDGLSGWEEYVIADVCIKALTKEETDCQVFMAQKAALLQRIEAAAENRDAGEPETVSDSMRRNFAWGDDGSFGGNGGAW
jgi:hypothetical protein